MQEPAEQVESHVSMCIWSGAVQDTGNLEGLCTQYLPPVLWACRLCTRTWGTQRLTHEGHLYDKYFVLPYWSNSMSTSNKPEWAKHPGVRRVEDRVRTTRELTSSILCRFASPLRLNATIPHFRIKINPPMSES